MAKIKPLRESPCFADFSDKELALFSRIVEEKSFSNGAEIFSENAASQGMFLLKSGEAEIIKNYETDQQRSLGFLSKGDICGELSLLEESRRRVTIKAKGTVEALFVSKEKFEEFAAKYAETATKLRLTLAKNIATRLREAGDVVTSLLNSASAFPPQKKE